MYTNVTSLGLSRSRVPAPTWAPLSQVHSTSPLTHAPLLPLFLPSFLPPCRTSPQDRSLSRRPVAMCATSLAAMPGRRPATSTPTGWDPSTLGRDRWSLLPAASSPSLSARTLFSRGKVVHPTPCSLPLCCCCCCCCCMSQHPGTSCVKETEGGGRQKREEERERHTHIHRERGGELAQIQDRTIRKKNIYIGPCVCLFLCLPFFGGEANKTGRGYRCLCWSKQPGGSSHRLQCNRTGAPH